MLLFHISILKLLQLFKVTNTVLCTTPNVTKIYGTLLSIKIITITFSQLYICWEKLGDLDVLHRFRSGPSFSFCIQLWPLMPLKLDTPYIQKWTTTTVKCNENKPSNIYNFIHIALALIAIHSGRLLC